MDSQPRVLHSDIKNRSTVPPERNLCKSLRFRGLRFRDSLMGVYKTKTSKTKTEDRPYSQHSCRVAFPSPFFVEVFRSCRSQCESPSREHIGHILPLRTCGQGRGNGGAAAGRRRGWSLFGSSQLCSSPVGTRQPSWSIIPIWQCLSRATNAQV